MSENVVQENVGVVEKSKFLLELILNAERDTQSWVKFLLTIESAIAFAFGYFLKQSSGDEVYNSSFMPWISALLALAGIASAIIVGSVVHRQRKWHSWYVQKFNELAGLQGAIFANQPGVIDRMPSGYIARRITWFQVCIITAWIAVIILSFCLSHG